MATVIERATPEEIPALLELICELARFERLEHEVVATVESLRESMFGSQPVATALLAREGKELVGYAIYFFTFSSFLGKRGLWLEDVYVRPEFRHRGIGRKLMEAVARVGVETHCGRFEWVALNWNEKALDIYQRMGAQIMAEWLLLRTNADGMGRIALAEPKRNRI